MAEKTFTVQVTIEERWIPYFMTMLQRMEKNGELGRSEYLSFFSDGEGDFKPKFKSDIEFDKAIAVKKIIESPVAVYDAG